MFSMVDSFLCAFCASSRQRSFPHLSRQMAHGPQFFVRDPARRGFHAISGLQDIGKLVDLVLYVAK
jgi:hypothetical protein